MLDISKDIRSLTDFKRETPKFLKQIRGSGRALVLTVNGEAELAVMSAATFQQVLEAIDELDMIRCVREGLQQAREGEGMPSEQFFASLRNKRKRSRAGA
ncbi:MAG: type II toxin-antitoxin system Phd/YefM family antitoxin [Planctomycetota bacterium]|jgi:PHD/YefM family antitoxin component YafN of YafNO toxin-antitoxin module